MPPVVIADSDDDGEERGHSSALSPSHATQGIGAQTRSSDGVSHATVSTDPAFFLSVFNEQKDAANLQIQETPGGALRQEDTISDISASVRGKRPEGAGLSSMTSVTDPVDQNLHNISGSKDLGDLTQVTTPRNNQAVANKTPNSRDMWDVPSSPEIKTKRKAPQKRIERSSRATTVKVTRGLRRNLERLGSRSEDEADDSISTEDRKRRKLSSSRGPSSRSPQEDAIGSLDAGRGRDTMSAVPVPTLPVDSDSSFLVVPNPPSASQKPGWQSTSPAQSGLSARHLEPEGKSMGSSGSATNLNTPQSNLLSSSHEAGITTTSPEGGAIGKARKSRSSRRWRDSSPDVTVATQLEKDGGYTEKRNAEECQVEDTAPDRRSLLDKEGEEYQGEIVPRGQPEEAGDAPFSVPDQPVRPKKQRGRPSKSVRCEDSMPINLATTAETDEALTAKPKKKRGRPKKVVQPADAEAVPPRDDVPTKPGARSEETANGVVAEKQVEGDRAGVEKDSRTLVSGSPSDRPPEMSSGVVGPTSVHKGESRPHVGDGGAEKDGRNGQTLSRPGATARPGYRVGLSKRLRIAPLLKSLPK